MLLFCFDNYKQHVFDYFEQTNRLILVNKGLSFILHIHVSFSTCFKFLHSQMYMYVNKEMTTE